MLYLLDELSIFSTKTAKFTSHFVHAQILFSLPALVGFKLLGLLLGELEELGVDVRQSHIIPHCVFDLVHQTVKLVHSFSLPSEIGAF